MQFIAGSKPFDRNDFGFIHKSRQVEASRDRHAIHDCGTATTQALSATLASAEKTEVAPQHFHERFVCCNVRHCRPAIQSEPDRSAVFFVRSLHASSPPDGCRSPRAAPAKRVPASAAFP